MTRLQNIKIEESIQGSAGSDVHDFVLKASAFVLLVAGYSLEQYHLSYALSKIQLILCMCMLYVVVQSFIKTFVAKQSEDGGLEAPKPVQFATRLSRQHFNVKAQFVMMCSPDEILRMLLDDR